MFDPRIANTLPNGAQILQRKKLTNSWHWLAYFGEGRVDPYVVWQSTTSQPGATFWGHYFDNLKAAETKFGEY